MNIASILREREIHNMLCEEYGELWEENRISCTQNEKGLIVTVGDQKTLYTSRTLAPASIERKFRQLRQESPAKALSWIRKECMGVPVNTQKVLGQKKEIINNPGQFHGRTKFNQDAFSTKSNPYTIKGGDSSKDNSAFNKPHNQQAYHEALEALETDGKCVIVQATGTGKSAVMSALLNDYSDTPTVYVSPKNEINDSFLSKQSVNNRQNLTQYTFAKCTSEAKKKDSFSELRSKLGDKKLGAIFVDEVHHIDAPEWRKSIEKLLAEFGDENTKIIGASATPENAKGEDITTASKIFKGAPKVSNLSLERAIEEGILPMPDYYNVPKVSNEDLLAIFDKEIAGVTDPYNKAIAMKEASNIMQKFDSAYAEQNKKFFVDKLKSLKKSNKGMKIAGFIPNKESANSGIGKYMQEIVKEAFPDKNVVVHFVHSDAPKVEKDFFRNEFCKGTDVDKDTIELVLTIDMFNEGVHAEGIDTLMMGRPTESKSVYDQELGRALDTCKGKSATVFDLVCNERNSVHQWDDIKKAYDRSDKPFGEKELHIDHEYMDSIDEMICAIRYNKPNGPQSYGQYKGHWTSFNNLCDDYGLDEKERKVRQNTFRHLISKGLSFEEAWKRS